MITKRQNALLCWLQHRPMRMHQCPNETATFLLEYLKFWRRANRHPPKPPQPPWDFELTAKCCGDEAKPGQRSRGLADADEESLLGNFGIFTAPPPSPAWLLAVSRPCCRGAAVFDVASSCFQSPALPHLPPNIQCEGPLISIKRKRRKVFSFRV